MNILMSKWRKRIFTNRHLELKHKIEQLEQVINELRVKDAQHKTIFDAQPDATVISNKDGIIVMTNNQVEMLLGYKSRELIGQSIEILVPEKFRAYHPRLRAFYCNSPYPRQMGTFPLVLALRKDGTEIDVEISLSPIETKQGFLFASSLRDVSIRKKFEADLKHSEERFRLMANYSPIMIWITNEKGEPTFSNQAWLDFVGWKEETITYNEWRQLVHPEDIKKAEFVDYFTNIKKYKTICIEYRLRDATGEWRWVLDQGAPMFDNAGVFIGCIGSLLDITEYKKAENELRIAAIAFESNEAMLITDKESVILRVNAAFTELTGYSSEEAIGQKTNFLRSGHHDDAFYQNMWNSLNRDGTWAGEIWDRRKNGEIFPKWLIITAVKNEAGIITNYVGAQSDISAQKAQDKRMYDLAYYDALTKLPNRRLVLERIEHCMSVAHRQTNQLAVLLLDLDKFKAVNDTFGHLAGDELLQQVALRLNSCVRESDTVARLGGDEFIVLLENITAPNDAGLVSENIIVALTTPFYLTKAEYVSIGVSIGISLYPQDGDNTVLLIENADAALYEAKVQGRGCFVYFSKLQAKA
jgi:diguanylate cyclase (GGDEF)-like protein/PAS domain S-box-containing protein